MAFKPQTGYVIPGYDGVWSYEQLKGNGWTDEQIADLGTPSTDNIQQDDIIEPKAENLQVGFSEDIQGNPDNLNQPKQISDLRSLTQDNNTEDVPEVKEWQDAASKLLSSDPLKQILTNPTQGFDWAQYGKEVDQTKPQYSQQDNTNPLGQGVAPSSFLPQKQVDYTDNGNYAKPQTLYNQQELTNYPMIQSLRSLSNVVDNLNQQKQDIKNNIITAHGGDPNLSMEEQPDVFNRMKLSMLAEKGDPNAITVSQLADKFYKAYSEGDSEVAAGWLADIQKIDPTWKPNPQMANQQNRNAINNALVDSYADYHLKKSYEPDITQLGLVANTVDEAFGLNKLFGLQDIVTNPLKQYAGATNKFNTLYDAALLGKDVTRDSNSDVGFKTGMLHGFDSITPQFNTFDTEDKKKEFANIMSTVGVNLSDRQIDEANAPTKIGKMIGESLGSATASLPEFILAAESVGALAGGVGLTAYIDALKTGSKLQKAAAIGLKGLQEEAVGKIVGMPAGSMFMFGAGGELTDQLLHGVKVNMSPILRTITTIGSGAAAGAGSMGILHAGEAFTKSLFNDKSFNDNLKEMGIDGTNGLLKQAAVDFTTFSVLGFLPGLSEYERGKKIEEFKKFNKFLKDNGLTEQANSQKEYYSKLTNADIDELNGEKLKKQSEQAKKLITDALKKQEKDKWDSTHKDNGTKKLGEEPQSKTESTPEETPPTEPTTETTEEKKPEEKPTEKKTESSPVIYTANNGETVTIAMMEDLEKETGKAPTVKQIAAKFKIGNGGANEILQKYAILKAQQKPKEDGSEPNADSTPTGNARPDDNLGTAKNDQGDKKDEGNAGGKVATPKNDGFVKMPIGDIKKNLGDYQGRTAEYSKRTYDSITQEAADGTLNISAIPAIQIWGKTGELLAGHSRLKAFEDLASGKMPLHEKFKPSDFTHINTQVVEADTREEAKKIAERSNSGSQQTPYENSKLLKKERAKGAKKAQINKYADQLAQHGDRQYTIHLSHLDDDGLAARSIETMSKNPEKYSREQEKIIEGAADKAGEMRMKFPELTRMHEDEIFEAIRDGKVKASEVYDRVDRAVNGVDEFNPNNKLNIEEVKNQSPEEAEYHKKEEGIRKELSELKRSLKKDEETGLTPIEQSYLEQATRLHKGDVEKGRKEFESEATKKIIQKKVDETKALIERKKTELTNHRLTKNKLVNQKGLFDEQADLTPEAEIEAKKADIEKQITELENVVNSKEFATTDLLKKHWQTRKDLLTNKIKQLRQLLRDGIKTGEDVYKATILLNDIRGTLNEGIDLNKTEYLKSLELKFRELAKNIESTFSENLIQEYINYMNNKIKSTGMSIEKDLAKFSGLNAYTLDGKNEEYFLTNINKLKDNLTQQKADIERRRQEELNKIDKQSGERLDSKDKINGEKLIVAKRVLENKDSKKYLESKQSTDDLELLGENVFGGIVGDKLDINWINRNYIPYKDKINAKYDAELAALEKEEVKPVSDIEAKKADIERRRQEELKDNSQNIIRNKLSSNPQFIKDFGINLNNNQFESTISSILDGVVKYGDNETQLAYNYKWNDYNISKINAKYDAELAALTPTTQVTPEEEKALGEEGIDKQDIQNFEDGNKDEQAPDNGIPQDVPKGGNDGSADKGEDQKDQGLEKKPKEKVTPITLNGELIIDEDGNITNVLYDKFEQLKKANDLSGLNELYSSVKIILNGVAQSKGEKTVNQFEKLKDDIEEYANKIKEKELTGSEKEYSVLEKQYKKIKAKHPDAIVLFRVGDHYEAIHDDAVNLSKVIGSVLTKRGNGTDDIEMSGFPADQMDTVLPKLVKSGHRVAIVDPLDQPKKNEKKETPKNDEKQKAFDDSLDEMAGLFDEPKTPYQEGKDLLKEHTEIDGVKADKFVSKMDSLYPLAKNSTRQVVAAIGENPILHNQIQLVYGSVEKYIEGQQELAERLGEKFTDATQSLRKLSDANRSTEGIPSKTVSPQSVETRLDRLNSEKYVIGSAQDVADLDTLFRSPWREATTAIIVRDGKIVWHSTQTTHLTYMSPLFNGATLTTIAKGLGADTIYLSHNHPSGNHKVSAEDIAGTKKFVGKLGDGIKFGGHVVIDHTKFSLIDENGQVSEHNFTTQKQVFSKRDLRIADDKDIAAIGSKILNENGFNAALVLRDSDGMFSGYVQIPEGMNPNEFEKFNKLQTLDKSGREGFIVHNGKGDVYSMSRDGKFPSNILDVVNTSNTKDIYKHSAGPDIFEGLNKSEAIHEPIAGYNGAMNADKDEANKRIGNLAVAKSMEESGRTDKEIALATGWEKGTDGKWKTLVTGKSELTVSLDDVKDNIQQGHGVSFILNDVLDYPELYKSYPELKNTQVIFYSDKTSPLAGSFDEFGQIHLNSDALTQNNLKSYLIHEIQHYIQRQEGFAEGTSIQRIFMRRLHRLGLSIEEYAKLPEIKRATINAYARTEYQRVSGEVEARLAQHIDNLPESQRNSKSMAAHRDDMLKAEGISTGDITDINNLLKEPGADYDKEKEARIYEAGIRMMKTATDNGIYSFSNIIKSFADKGMDRTKLVKMIPYLQKIYTSFLGDPSISDDAIALMDNPVEVRKFTLDSIHPSINDKVNGTGNTGNIRNDSPESPKEQPTGNVQPTNKKRGTEQVLQGTTGELFGGGEQNDQPRSAKTRSGTRELGHPDLVGPKNEVVDKELGGESDTNNVEVKPGEGVVNPNRHAGNFVIPQDFTHGATFNPVQHYEDNIAAIRLIIKLSEEKRQATPEEQNILFKYVGFGGLKDILLNPDKPSAWADSNLKLKPYVKEVIRLLHEFDPSGELYENVKKSTSNAHYTPIPVIRGIYDVLKQAGFDKGTILEPSMGTGHFFGAAPYDMLANSILKGVELDPITAEIAKHLYPSASVKNEGLQNSGVQPNSADLVISNIPFGKEGVYDPTWRGKKKEMYRVGQHTIHNYFFIKAIDTVRPNGLIAFVTSTGVMDSGGNKKIREAIAEQCEFMGAIRLPNTAFKGNAGTSVTSDIIFLRKLGATEKPKSNEFVETREADVPNREGKVNTISYNKYFHDHPEMMLGVPASDSMYADSPAFSLNADERAKDIQNEISKLAKKIFPNKVFSSTKNIVEVVDAALEGYNATLKHEQPGSIVLHNGKPALIETGKFIDLNLDEKARELGINPDKIRENDLYLDDIEKLKKAGLSVEDFQKINVKPIDLGDKNNVKIPAYLKLRDDLIGLLKDEMAGVDDADLMRKRSKLMQSYQDFERKFGKVNDKSNSSLIKTDIDGPKVAALEVYKSNDDGKYVFSRLADIFTKRTVRPQTSQTKADDIHSAITISLNEKGKIDADLIKKLLGVDDNTLHEMWKGSVYEKPEGGWEPADEYLSGNVRKKLRLAEAAAQTNERFNDNVDALKKVIPADISASDIHINPGATWIPIQYYQQFAKDMLGVSNVTVVRAGYPIYSVTDSTGNNDAIYGTSQRKASEILSAILNNKAIVVTKTDSEGKTYTDTEATAAANFKAEQMIRMIKEWMISDSNRADKIAAIFNDKFNSEVVLQPNGKHLTLPGLSPEIKVDEWKKDTVYKLIRNDGGLVDHEVGLGKTFIMAISAMEMRRLGVSNKPMLLCLKANVADVVREFQNLYPGANVLYPTSSDFEKGKRRVLLAKMATGNWDAIVLTHDQYKMIPQDDEIQKEILVEQIQQLESALNAMSGDDGPSKRQLKGLEQRIKSLEAKLDRLKNFPRDKSLLSFQDIGIDHLMIDESHFFKNVPFATAINRVAGMGQPDGSQRALNMLYGIRSIQKMKQGDRGATLLTGTPITNTIAEAYNIMQYLIPNKLQEMGIGSFDEWTKLFAEKNSDIEFGATNTLKQKERFRYFGNLPELAKIYQSFADVKFADEVGIDRPSISKTHLLTVDNPIERGSIVTINGKEYKVFGNSKALYGKTNVSLVAVDKTSTPPEKGNIIANGSELPYSSRTTVDGTIVNIPQTEEQAEFSQALTEWVNSQGLHTKSTPLIEKWNLPTYSESDPARSSVSLQATTKAAKAAIDMRLVYKEAKRNPEGKLATAAKLMYEKWKDTTEHKGVQLMFSDIGTPKASNTADNLRDYYEMNTILDPDTLDSIFGEVGSTRRPMDKIINALEEEGFSREDIDEHIEEANKADMFDVYKGLKEELVALGVPENEIEFIHDHDTEVKKKRLMDRAREGKVRFIFGSTSKLGTGVNIQAKLVGLFHLDAPWGFHSLDQRNGRGVRRGADIAKMFNNNVMDVHYLLTDGSLDAYKHQLIGIKRNFAEQFRKGTISERYVDEGETDSEGNMSMNALAAIISGNPELLEKQKLANKVKKLEAAKRGAISQKNNYLSKATMLENMAKEKKVLGDKQAEDAVEVEKHIKKDEQGEPIYQVKIGDHIAEKAKEAGRMIIEERIRSEKSPTFEDKKIGEVLGMDILASKTHDVDFDGNYKSVFQLRLRGKSGMIYRINSSDDQVGQGTSVWHYPLKLKESSEKNLDFANNRGQEIEGLREAADKVEFKGDDELNKAINDLNDINGRLRQIAEEQKVKDTQDQLNDEGFVEEPNKPYTKTIMIDGKQVEVKSLPEDAEVVNGFYSPMQKAILEAKNDKQTGAKWLQQLQSKGVKADELQFTGTKDFLEKNRDKTISKADLHDYWENNKIQVVEVVKDDRKGLTRKETIEFNKLDKEIDVLEKERTRLARESYDKNVTPDRQPEYQEVTSKIKVLMIDWERLRDKAQDKSKDTKFSQYQLEGDKSGYKEVLITMPSVEKKSAEVVMVGERPTDGYNVIVNGKVINKEPFASRSKANDYVDTIDKNKGKTDFKSTHFDEPNILAHLRMNVRTDAEGKKTLFIEELQSDWNAKARKEGVKKQITELPKEWEVVNKNPNGNDWQVIEKGNPDHIITAAHFGKPNTKENATNAGIEYANSKGVADAPFIKDTNAVVKLQLKTALQHAVKEGAERIAWTTGEQQNERYDLSKVLNAVEWNINHDGTYDVQGNKIDGGYYTQRKLDAKGIEAHFGKDIADKITSSKEGEGKIEGVDLKVGGKGMIGFYGSPKENKLGIVGQVAESMFGKGSVKNTEIETAKNNEYTLGDSPHYADGTGVEVYDGNGDLVKVFDTKSEADKFISDKSKSTQHSIDITPEMRSEVEKGQPLFEPSTAYKNSRLLVEEKQKELEQAKRALENKKKELSKTISKAQGDIFGTAAKSLIFDTNVEMNRIDDVLEPFNMRIEKLTGELRKLQTASDKLKDTQDNLLFNESEKEYKTKTGESIPYKQLGMFDDTSEPEVQRKSDKKPTDSFPRRKLKPGEFSHVELSLETFKHFNFTTRTEKLRSPEDVAFIFKSLQDYSVEAGFAVHVKKDGTFMVQFLGMGDYAATVMSVGSIHAVAHKFKSKDVFLVHNHPSGKMQASEPDMKMLKQYSEVAKHQGITAHGVIINLLSGKYLYFNSETNWEGHASGTDKSKVEVMTFNKRVFNENVSMEKVKNSRDIASFISASRYSDGDKAAVLLLDNNLTILGNVILSKDVNKANMSNNIKEILNAASMHGSRSVVIYGKFENAKSSVAVEIKKALKNTDVNLTDFIVIGSNPKTSGFDYKSTADEGLMEPGTELHSPTVPYGLSKQDYDDLLDDIRIKMHQGVQQRPAIKEVITDYCAKNPQLSLKDVLRTTYENLDNEELEQARELGIKLLPEMIRQNQQDMFGTATDNSHIPISQRGKAQPHTLTGTTVGYAPDLIDPATTPNAAPIPQAVQNKNPYYKFLRVVNKGQEVVWASPLNTMAQGSARIASKALVDKSYLVRNIAGFINSFTRFAIPATMADAADRMKGKWHEVTAEANLMEDAIRKIVNHGKNGEYARMHQVMDPEFYLKTGQTPLDYSQLTPEEKKAIDILKGISRITHTTNFVNRSIGYDTYLKFKDKYLARHYADDNEQVLSGRERAMKMLMGMYQEREEEVTKWMEDHIVKDPIYSVMQRYHQTIVNKAISDYCSYIQYVHPYMVLDKKLEPAEGQEHYKGFTKLSNGYGILSNRYVADIVAEDLKGFFYTNGFVQKLHELGKAYDKWFIRKYFRQGLTIYSLPTQITNETSNQILAHLLGVNPYDLNRLIVNGTVGAEIKNFGPAYRKLLMENVLNTDLTREDLVAMQNQILDYRLGEKKGKGISKVSADLKKFYTAVDNYNKISAYLNLLERGVDEDSAIDAVRKGFQNASRIPKFFDLLSKIPFFGPMFAKWSGDLQRIVRHSLSTKPLQLGVFISLLQATSTILSLLAGESDDDKKKRIQRPGTTKIPLPDLTDIVGDWIKYVPVLNFVGGAVPLSWKVKGDKEINVSRLLSPLYTFNSMNSSDATELFQKLFLPINFESIDYTNNPSGSVATWLSKMNADPSTAWMNLLFNSDFIGRPILDPKETKYQQSPLTDNEKLANAMTYLVRQYIPAYGSMADDFVRALRGDKDYYDRERTPAQVLAASFLGVKMQDFPKEKYANIVFQSINTEALNFKGAAQKLDGVIKYFNDDVAEIQKKNLTPYQEKVAIQKAQDLAMKRAAPIAQDMSIMVEDMKDKMNASMDVLTKQMMDELYKNTSLSQKETQLYNMAK